MVEQEEPSPLQCLIGGMVVIPLGIAVYYLLYILKIIEEVGREIFKVEPIITVTQAALILALISFIITFIVAYLCPICAILTVAGIIFMAALFIQAGLLKLLEITLGDIIVTITASFLAIGLKAYIARQEAKYYY